MANAPCVSFEKSTDSRGPRIRVARTTPCAFNDDQQSALAVVKKLDGDKFEATLDGNGFCKANELLRILSNGSDPTTLSCMPNNQRIRNILRNAQAQAKLPESTAASPPTTPAAPTGGIAAAAKASPALQSKPAAPTQTPGFPPGGAAAQDSPPGAAGQSPDGNPSTSDGFDLQYDPALDESEEYPKPSKEKEELRRRIKSLGEKFEKDNGKLREILVKKRMIYSMNIL